MHFFSSKSLVAANVECCPTDFIRNPASLCSSSPFPLQLFRRARHGYDVNGQVNKNYKTHRYKLEKRSL